MSQEKQLRRCADVQDQSVDTCLLSFLGLFSFFFSSRRRHTRSLCDWSSDVCSSDLLAVGLAVAFLLVLRQRTPTSTNAERRPAPPVAEPRHLPLQADAEG